MRYFPVFFDLRGQNVLVVGGGEIALRKVSLLERTGAAITVVSPEAVPELVERSGAAALRLVAREFEAADLDGVRLVIAATGRRSVNRWIANLSEARGVPVNAVDDLEASRFIVPAIVDRDPVLVAVSSGGTSPVLARRLRERLEALVPKRMGEFAGWLRDLRKSSMERLRGTTRAASILRDSRGRSGGAPVHGWRPPRRRAHRAAAHLADLRGAACGGRGGAGGRGPRRPGIADDQGAARTAGCRRDPARSPGPGRHSRPGAARRRPHLRRQVRRRREHPPGARSMPCSSGMPPRASAWCGSRAAIRSSSGAAARSWRRWRPPGVDFSVVPGITAAAGVAAYAGIPLTHRDHAHAVTFVTGHCGEDGTEPDWKALAAAGTTAVFYMGLAPPRPHRCEAAGARRRGGAARGPHRPRHAAAAARDPGDARHHRGCGGALRHRIAGAAGGRLRGWLAVETRVVPSHSRGRSLPIRLNPRRFGRHPADSDIPTASIHENFLA